MIGLEGSDREEVGNRWNGGTCPGACCLWFRNDRTWHSPVHLESVGIDHDDGVTSRHHRDSDDHNHPFDYLHGRSLGDHHVPVSSPGNAECPDTDTEPRTSSCELPTARSGADSTGERRTTELRTCSFSELRVQIESPVPDGGSAAPGESHLSSSYAACLPIPTVGVRSLLVPDGTEPLGLHAQGQVQDMSNRTIVGSWRWIFVALLVAAPWIASGSSPASPEGSQGPRHVAGAPLATGTSTDPSTGPSFQIIGSGKLETLAEAPVPLSPVIVNYFFNQPKAFVATGANGQPVAAAVSHIAAIHAKYPLASPTWLFNSYGPNFLTNQPGILGVFGPGGAYGPGMPNPPGLSVVQYDPEGQVSNGTPQAECDALNAGDLTYVKAAIALVHAKGLRFLLSPSADVGMTGGTGSYPTKYATWINQGRGAWAAAGEDYYSIQSQQAEGTPYWASFVSQAIAQAKSAAPQVPIGVGIGINPHNPPTVITPQILMDAHNTAMQSGAAGFWQNIELGVNANVPASVYVDFFTQLYAASGV